MPRATPLEIENVFRGRRRRAFTLVELLVVIGVIGVVAALLFMAVMQVREAARRHSCGNNLRQIGLAMANFESAHRELPTASSAPGSLLDLSDPTQQALPAGAAGNQQAGYSFMVQVIPFMEEVNFHTELSNLSSRFETPAFDRNLLLVSAADRRHFSMHPLEIARCPSFAGPYQAEATEYTDFASSFGPTTGVALGNYVAVVGSHVESGKGVVENGAIVSASASGGSALSAITDGTSNTIMLTESREQKYGSWYDGQSAWVVALQSPRAADTIALAPDGSDGVLGPGHALNYGPRDGLRSIYLQQGVFPGVEERAWGPSSFHPGGVVMHLFADNRVEPIPDTIDPSVYYRLTTRGGGEPVPQPIASKSVQMEEANAGEPDKSSAKNKAVFKPSSPYHDELEDME